MKHFFILFFILHIFSGMSLAQEGNIYQGKINVSDVSILKDPVQQKLNISFRINLDELHISSNKVITLTPTLIKEDGTHQLSLTRIVVSGKNRMKYLKRAAALKNTTRVDLTQTETYIVRKNGKQQKIPVHFQVPEKKWMSNIRLVLNEEVTGCHNCPPVQKETVIVQRILRKTPLPLFQAVYICPTPEPAKERSEVYQAHLSFKVSKWDLLTHYRENNEKLKEIDQVISRVKNDELITITAVKLTGYASPEGNYESNIKLSERRAYAFANYLQSKYSLSPSIMKVDWKGEDWEGLQTMMKKSFLAEKEQIMQIITHETDPNIRKQKIVRLSGGTPYTFLLNNYYPLLRRNEYKLEFVVSSLTVEKARDLIKTKPEYLSLNEMYLVANSYPQDSKEFKEVFEIALRIYPNAEVARLNAATADLESGMWGKAIAQLSELHSVQAINNLGVAYMRKGAIEEGSIYLKKAADKGLKEAQTNWDLYKKWKQENQ